jgi:hypothetical protein
MIDDMKTSMDTNDSVETYETLIHNIVLSDDEVISEGRSLTQQIKVLNRQLIDFSTCFTIISTKVFQEWYEVCSFCIEYLVDNNSRDVISQRSTSIDTSGYNIFCSKEYIVNNLCVALHNNAHKCIISKALIQIYLLTTNEDFISKPSQRNVYMISVVRDIDISTNVTKSKSYYSSILNITENLDDRYQPFQLDIVREKTRCSDDDNIELSYISKHSSNTMDDITSFIIIGMANQKEINTDLLLPTSGDTSSMIFKLSYRDIIFHAIHPSLVKNNISLDDLFRNIPEFQVRSGDDFKTQIVSNMKTGMMDLSERGLLGLCHKNNKLVIYDILNEENDDD